jgi:uncharacterized membrane protein YoaK (UPF0700 family)
MHRHSTPERIVAVGLAGLAGFVDSHAFLELGGYFVSFMSGNTTRLGAGVIESVHSVLLPLSLIALFVLGVAGGTIAARLSRIGPPGIMLIVSALLALSALLAGLGHRWAATALLAVAMGVENGVFVRDGEVTIALTYVTGALVRFGQKIAVAILGGERWGWVWPLLLWLGLAIGAALGAVSYLTVGLWGLWIGVAGSLALSLALRHVGRSRMA